MMKAMTLESLNRVYGGAEIDHKKKADDDLGFKHKDWVIWTRHPEYGVGMYGYGILGVAFVVFDERKAGIGGSLVLERELVEAY